MIGDDGMTAANRIHHVNLMVDDLEAADVFYGDVLGLERATTPDLGFPASCYTVNEHQQLHVNQLDDVRPERAHFCLRLADFDGLAARAIQLGIVEAETWGKARRLPTGEMQLFVRDPSGNLIELSCEADQPVDPAFFEHDFVAADPQFFHRSE
jgi:catechol 2,3-dioxygenase-like lactoylglutathione lyase family enzyme